MFKKNTYISLTENSSKKPEVPEGLLKKCNACKSAIFAQDVKNADYICPKCHNYFRIHARHRIEMVADEGSFEEWNTDLVTRNPLHYKGYEEKIKMMQEKTGLDEAVLTGSALVHGIKAAIGVCDSRFIMASMGEVVGEKITRMVERATEEKLPVILFACSGGARMQEGIVSLMQMAKTSAALKRHSDAGLLYISVLTNPTTGGVTASFASDSPSLPWEAFVLGSIASSITGSGNSMDSRITGCCSSQMVSPVVENLNPIAAAISPEYTLSSSALLLACI